MAEKCKECTKEVKVQIQKNTGFCGALCEKAAKRKKLSAKERKKAKLRDKAKQSVNAVVE